MCSSDLIDRIGRHRCLVYRIHDFCFVLARFEKCNGSCGSHPYDYPRSTDYRYLFAIIRRTLSGQKFYKPDRNHLHHRLLSLGLTHRGTVLVIYGISMIFSLISLLLNISSRIGGVLLVIGLLFGVELLAELIGVLGPHHSPLLNLLRYIGNSSYREEVRQKRKEKTK